MSAQMLLQSFAGGDDEKTYVDDVFSTYLYTGNSSTQTINNGIDLAGEGGLVWLKNRGTTSNHILMDTERGLKEIYTNNTSQQYNSDGFTGFTGSGFSLGSGNANTNGSGASVASWTFRRAPKFFDIVTYTGNGVAGRQIPHELGIAPGMIIVKCTNINGLDWAVYHRSTGSTQRLLLNTTGSAAVAEVWTANPDSTTFTVGNFNLVNGNGNAYVAYLFAHDSSEDGIIQCGSFTQGSVNQDIQLGWEPQYVLVKSASILGDWCVFDTMRGFYAPTTPPLLLSPNTSTAEGSIGPNINVHSNGFTLVGTNGGGFNAGTYIYLAIRRPNKPPKSGTEVYNAIARTGTGANATITGVGFAPDLGILKNRIDAGNNSTIIGRLTGKRRALLSDVPIAEQDYSSAIGDFTQDGVSLLNGVSGTNQSTITYINHFFRRAPGFFDIVCDTGTGTVHAINHSLTVAPELIIRKSRSAATQWEWWHSALAATEKLVLNSTAGKATDATAFGTLPTATQFYVGASSNTNASAATYVTYLFATCPGVSKVGYYTGNGTSLTVECGFSTGARFILAKSIDDAGDSFIWDTARGIIAANDPHLSLNTTAAEVTTDDSVDPYAGGFIVNQNTATNINVNGKRYAYLAIA